MPGSVPAITSADSSDLELQTDSSSSGDSPRMGASAARPPLALALAAPQALRKSFHEALEDKDEVPTTTHVSIKPNLKLMSNSERGKYYRRKRKNYAAELSLSVNKLRRQVQMLVAAQQLRQELVLGHRQTPLGALAKLVHEYCAQFEFGTPVMMAPAIGSACHYPGATTTMQLARVSAASSEQARFLHAAMEERVGFGEFSGIPLLLDQWERYSKYHAALRFELKSLDVVNPSSALIADGGETEDLDEPVAPVIVVRADLHVRYSLETIEQVFPHLLSDLPLVQELIGLEVSYPCVNRFYFSASGKIERYDPEVDFMGALAVKIRSLKGVAHVLSRALIAKDHMIGALDDLQGHSEPQIVEIQYDEDTATRDTKTARDRKVSAEINGCSEARTTSPVQTKSKSRFDLNFILS